MATFSPGTWVSMDGVDGGFADAVVCITDDDHISPVARPPEAPEGDNWAADALLIAAAPDLYAALEYAFAKMPSDDPNWRPCIEEAYAALQKAKGGTP